MTITRSHALKIAVSLSLTVVLVVLSAHLFRKQNEPEALHPSAALTRTLRLSEINPHLKGTPGDTDVYVFDSGVPGGSLLVLGGTHASEIAGQLTAVMMLENLRVDAGRVFIIPFANASAITNTEP